MIEQVQIEFSEGPGTPISVVTSEGTDAPSEMQVEERYAVIEMTALPFLRGREGEPGPPSPIEDVIEGLEATILPNTDYAALFRNALSGGTIP